MSRSLRETITADMVGNCINALNQDYSQLTLTLLKYSQGDDSDIDEDIPTVSDSVDTQLSPKDVFVLEFAPIKKSPRRKASEWMHCCEARWYSSLFILYLFSVDVLHPCLYNSWHCHHVPHRRCYSCYHHHWWAVTLVRSIAEFTVIFMHLLFYFQPKLINLHSHKSL